MPIPNSANWAGRFLIKKIIRIILFSLSVLTYQKLFAAQFFVGLPSNSLPELNPATTQLIHNYQNLNLILVESINEPSIESALFVLRTRTISLETHQSEALQEEPPFFSNGQTWGQQAIHAPQAWSFSRGQGTKVMVIDSGIDRNHPDLKSKIVKTKDFLNTPITFFHPYPEYDITGHGTHVAGTIAGEWFGIAPQASLYVARACDFLCMNPKALVGALDWAIEEQVDIINMSLSSKSFPQVLADHIFSHIENNNILVVAASGNKNGNQDQQIHAPANIPVVLAVGAIDEQGSVAAFSKFGPELSLVAPGVNILSASLTRGNNQEPQLMTFKNGTSMASPHVAGTAALIKSINPLLTAAQVRQILLDSASRSEAMNPLYYGAGVLNAEQAVLMTLESFQL